MLTYSMNQREETSKYYFLYKSIKEDILSGVLKKNEKLPSKRSLAEHLGLSLITVENAYQMLKDEGYIESRERSGYFVTELRMLKKRGRLEKELELLEHGNANRKQLHMLETHTMGAGNCESENEQKTVCVEQKDSLRKGDVLFPESVYFKTVRSVLTEYGSELLVKAPNEGCAILRNAIAKYLLRYRGIFAQPEQIIIGSGAEYLYSTVVRMFGTEKVFALEDPSYEQIRKVYEGMGARCEMLKMGKEGILSTELEKTTADILHVTPFHSYPSGVTATVRKRQEYLEWVKHSFDCEESLESSLYFYEKEGAKEYLGNNERELSKACLGNGEGELSKAYLRDVSKRERIIIEDDFDSEFFMPGKPIETLYMLDEHQNVIYINTFSKSLSPSIRIGYMILPEKYLMMYRESMGNFSCTVPVLDQYVLAEFIDRGHFEQHLNRVRKHRER